MRHRPYPPHATNAAPTCVLGHGGEASTRKKDQSARPAGSEVRTRSRCGGRIKETVTNVREDITVSRSVRGLRQGDPSDPRPGPDPRFTGAGRPWPRCAGESEWKSGSSARRAPGVKR